MVLMTVQTLISAQKGDTECVQQVFDYCYRFINSEASLLKSNKFKCTMGFYPDLSFDDVCHDVLIASVDKVISFFNYKLSGNNVEAFIGQAIKFCANNWLTHKNRRTFSPHQMVCDQVKVLRHKSLADLVTKVDEGKADKVSEYFKDNCWTPEQYMVYNSICENVGEMLEAHIKDSKIKPIYGTDLSPNVSLEKYLAIYKMILGGEKKSVIAEKFHVQYQIINRLHYNVLNPLFLLAMDDDGIYEIYLEKLQRPALNLVKSVKGIVFLRRFGLQ